MNLQLLTFLCRQMIKLHIHIVMIRHIAALQISGPRELRRDMLFSVGTGLIIKQL